jgi:hypothetical protein
MGRRNETGDDKIGERSIEFPHPEVLGSLSHLSVKRTGNIKISLYDCCAGAEPLL